LVALGRDRERRRADDHRRRTSGVRGMTGFLALEDGTVFRGESVAADGFAVGEAVFTTAMTGYQEIVTDPSFAEQLICFTAPMVGGALAAAVSTAGPYVYSDAGRARIAVVDYGCKRSILRRLAGAGAAVTVFPHDATCDELARFEGVLLSNGPGDPEPLVDEVAVIRELLGRVPILGICLGHQLLALA